MGTAFSEMDAMRVRSISKLRIRVLIVDDSMIFRHLISRALGVDGLQMLKNVRRLHPQLRIVMFSALTSHGASTTLEALSLGADGQQRGLGMPGVVAQAGLADKIVPSPKLFQRFCGW
jgi:hypothetical protein